MAAPADKIWNLIADVRNTGGFHRRHSRRIGLTAPPGPRSGHASVGTCGATRSDRSIGRRAG
ncbi:hypothetical protein I553_6343 [Mycobacterium xenopi 4042]|uniref:Uncharacterized protein n=1 Tax=Mycobacterium xenopi 4042 TaxID=1299334 RepID=X8BGW1_MYCXE|nr:hypothetical protein I553_6343 [Mycobacterium xenopi 4042]